MADLTPDTHQISHLPEVEAAQDYYGLRSLGIKLLSKLGTEIWTDFNVHDPGITMLETLTYAITDLGFRTAFPIADILADLSVAQLEQSEFHTAGQILPSNPVTVLDFRKLLIDQDGVSNAWISEGDPFVGIKGLRKIVIQPTDAQLDLKGKEALRKAVANSFWAHRNLGETLESVHLLRPEPIVLRLQIIVSASSQPETVLAGALIAIDQLLQSAVSFLNLDQMTAQADGDMTSVFEGPLLTHGFIPDTSLQPQVEVADPEAMIKCILGIDGLESVVRLEIMPQFIQVGPGNKRVLQQPNADGTLDLFPGFYPILDPTLNKYEFKVIQGRKPYAVDMQALSHEITRLKALQPASKNAPQAIDLPIPQGKNRDLSHYYTVQYDLPSVYNMGPNPGILSTSAPVAQLRGYLILFDQVLANYLSQLAKLSQLFSWDASVQRTYFFQGLEQALADFTQMLVGTPILGTAPPTHQQADALRAGLARYYERLGALRESRAEFLQRRTLFLDHLLARLGRSLESYVQRLPQGDPEQRPQFYIDTAQRFLADYPSLSADRGNGGNPLTGASLEDALPGLQNTLEAILGLPAWDAQDADAYSRFQLEPGAVEIQHAFEGLFRIRTDDGTPIRMPHLVSLGIDRRTYRLMQVPEQPGIFSISLIPTVLQGEPGECFTFVNTFSDTEAVEAAIQQSLARFQAFSRASERIYVIDHSLLRPAPDAPVHGLEILDDQQKPLLNTKDWFPVWALESVQDLDASNSTIDYLGGGGTPVSSPPSSPPEGLGESPPSSSPPAPAPLEGPTSFVFQLYAWQNGQPFPVFPPNGSVLAGGFAVGSPTVTAVYPSQAFFAYLNGFYSKLIASPLALGQALALDFQTDALPDDWVSSGKSEMLEEWGQYGLYQALVQWQADYGPFSSFEAALTSALAMPPAQGEATASPPATDTERALLVGLIRTNYPSSVYQATDFSTQLQADLATLPPASTTFNLNARAYLATAGRALGTCYLATYFPDLQLEQLGEALTYALGLQDPPTLESSLEEFVGNYLAETLTTQTSTPADSQSVLHDLLHGQRSPDDAPFQDTIAGNGWTLWTNWIASRCLQSDSPLAVQKAMLSIYLAVHPQLPSLLESADSLSALVSAQIVAQVGSPPVQPSNTFSAAVMRPADAQLDILPAAQMPPSLEDTLKTAMMQACTFYVQHHLSQPGGGGAQGAAIRQALGLDSTGKPESIWQLGDQALHHYLQTHFPNGLPDATTIGSKLQQLLHPTPGQDPALPSIGAFHLTDFLQKTLSSPQAAAQPPGEYLRGLLNKAIAAQPPANTGANDGSSLGGLLSGWLHNLTHPAGPTTSPPPDTHSALGAINLASLVGKLLPPPWNSAVALLQKVGLFQHPIHLSALPGEIVNSLRNAGHSFMQTYMASRFRWQLTHAGALGNAAKSIVPASPGITPGTQPFPPPPPVRYGISLRYRIHDVPVYLESARLLASEKDALDQIQALQKRIPQFKSGDLGFETLFRSMTYLPPALTSLVGTALNWRDLYSCKVSVLVPDWPARFQEPGFREQLAQIVEEESPAHFQTHCLWLSKQAMQVFEPSYTAWMGVALQDAARYFYNEKILDFILEETAASVAAKLADDSHG